MHDQHGSSNRATAGSRFTTRVIDWPPKASPRGKIKHKKAAILVAESQTGTWVRPFVRANITDGMTCWAYASSCRAVVGSGCFWQVQLRTAMQHASRNIRPELTKHVFQGIASQGGGVPRSQPFA